ncbi:hypothetical protein K437DRAFT_254537 [Tilletiaria anomala UBC 951]|uniref:Efficient mitochondria targeting-associated protein 19 n=1 Tax=Tilletiaria anomala (strain ATCC 24038 / CBS 436.72 / UBC 951) TaxID=1037660 RepID=A0A066WHZ8_TILAU|nr:uncharacterized protein K437DRAFT_254537 [Tilletiaria anomala UBC 951]KDN52158.1 hypothetical protein K437DRAFT_254537 [Tilletiaria anomala UBC 951]
MPRSLTSRPADLAYVVFLVLHLFASLLIDGQAFYPASLVPQALKSVRSDYLRDSRDPLLGNALHPRYAWFTLCLVAEMVVQVPAFIAGAYGLIRDDARFYPIIIAYASWATLSTAECMVTVLFGDERKQLSHDNLRFLLSSYGPFTIIPAIMLVDFIIRTSSILGSTQVAEKNKMVLKQKLGESRKLSN